MAAPKFFQWTDVDVLACGPDQVVIKNEYISIEGGDLIAREIMPPERVPHIVGYQSAGEIVEVGADVQDRWVGQKVVTIVTTGSHAAWGSHAEFTVTAANMTWVIPAALSVDIAAAIPVTFGTAHECLFEFGHRGEVSPFSFMPAPVRLAWRPSSSRSGQVRECSRPHRMTQSLRA